MRIFDVDIATCERIARELGIRFEGSDTSNSRGARTNGVLRKGSGTNPYPRVSASPFPNKDGSRRRMPHCVCWHGHRDFMRAVFAVNPNARIVTGLAGEIDYRGADDFERKYLATGGRNIGSLMYPVRMAEACSCPERGYVQ